ncbi:GGDEF domain-containing protein [Caminibacter sp.]
MYKKKSKFNSFTSSALLLFLGFIFIIVVGNEFIISNSIKNLSKYDAIIINNLGKIRGDIQRYVKIKLYKNKSPKLKIIKKDINSYFSSINLIITNDKYFIPKKYIIQLFDLLNSTQNIWNNITVTNNKNELFNLSEKAWQKANKLTNFMTYITNYKLKTLQKIVLIFTIISGISIMLISFFVIMFVKKGLEKASITDPLTKLYNRLYFDLQYNYLINKFARNKTPFSAFLFDIDNFKQINDTYGHPVGDKVLEEISEIIKNSIRKTDIAFRYGGEEFIILFPETTQNKAVKIAERIKNAISKNIRLENKPVTISGGVGEYTGKYSKYHFLNEIDKALYLAKNSGKNRIITIT